MNKVSSKVDLRLDLSACEEILGASRLARIREKLGRRIDADGCLQVVSSEHRTQAQNLEQACERMQELLKSALRRPRVRRATRPTRASKERRIDEKKKRSEVKKRRGGKFED